MKGLLRNRLWATLIEYNEAYYYRPNPNDNWNEETSHLEQTDVKLRKLLGFGNTLRIKTPAGFKDADLESYFKLGYPSCALDVIEQFYQEVVNPDKKGILQGGRLQAEVDEAMVAFHCPWRLSDGQFFQVDSDFLDQEINQKTESLLREHGFQGAHDEFRSALEDLSGDEPKDAIIKACKSFESTLKIATGKNGDFTALQEAFRKAGFMDDIPEDDAKAICKQVLGSLPTLRNKLGAHGQGDHIVHVPRPYALLAVYLAGALNQFVVDLYLNTRKQHESATQEPEEPPDLDVEPDIPF
jgi:hypothetical protein